MVEEKKTKLEKEDTKMKEETKVEKKENKKAEAPKKKVQEIKPKEKAIARAYSARASPKTSIAICKMIKNKTPDRALEDLELVLRQKKVVKMHSAEVGHKPGKRTAGGRYPVAATKVFIDLVKQLKANAENHNVENAVIVIAKVDNAPRPYRRDGRRGKRAHIYLEVKDKTKLERKK
jgi:ribosomal protein L22